MARFVLELDDGSASVMRNLQPHELSFGALAKCLETPAWCALHIHRVYGKGALYYQQNFISFCDNWGKFGR